MKKKAGNNFWKLADLKLIKGNGITYGGPCRTLAIARDCAHGAEGAAIPA